MVNGLSDDTWGYCEDENRSEYKRSMKHFSGDMADTVRSQRKDLVLAKFDHKVLNEELLNKDDRDLATKLKRMGEE